MAEMPQGMSGSAAMIIAIMVLALAILLLWLIVWKCNNAARWTYVLIHVPDLALAPVRPAASLHWGPFWATLGLGQYACVALCLWMLFRQDTRDWFSGVRPVDPGVFS